jgi:hypothetical protein
MIHVLKDDMKNMIHIINHIQIIVYPADKIMNVIIRIAIMQHNDLLIVILQMIEDYEIVVMKMKENVLIFHQILEVELLLIMIKK